MTIAHCQRCESRTEHGDLRCAVCGTALDVDRSGAVRPALTILRCDSCAAAIQYDLSALAPRCAFCDSTVHVESIEDPPEQIEHFLPFQISREAAHDSVREWLGTLGFFRPSDLKTSATLDTIKPLWWVSWIFDADALVSWTADSNAGSGRSAWAPHSGQQHFQFKSILVSASRGLSDEEVRTITDGYELGTAMQGVPAAQDVIVEQFDVQRSEARNTVSDAIMGMATGHVQAGCIPGSRFRNVHVEPLLRGLITHRMALPAYVMAYRYKGKLYRVVLNAQNPTFLRGDAPYSWAKILLVILLAVGVIALVGAIIAGSS